MKDRGLQFTDATGITLSDYVRYESWIKKNHLTISDNLTNMLAGYVRRLSLIVTKIISR